MLQTSLEIGFALRRPPDKLVARDARGSGDSRAAHPGAVQNRMIQSVDRLSSNFQAAQLAEASAAIGIAGRRDTFSHRQQNGASNRWAELYIETFESSSLRRRDLPSAPRQRLPPATVPFFGSAAETAGFSNCTI